MYPVIQPKEYTKRFIRDYVLNSLADIMSYVGTFCRVLFHMLILPVLVFSCRYSVAVAVSVSQVQLLSLVKTCSCWSCDQAICIHHSAVKSGSFCDTGTLERAFSRAKSLSSLPTQILTSKSGLVLTFNGSFSKTHGLGLELVVEATLFLDDEADIVWVKVRQQ